MESISIIGGGIAGLALAACLDPNRFDVTVIEKRQELPVVGTVLAMWPHAQRALETVGILEDVRRCSPVVSSGALRNAAGAPWISIDGADAVAVSRMDLLHLLDAAVPDSVRRITRQVDSVASGVDLVVGADGVHSAIRRDLWGARTGARLTPYLAVRGVVPVPVNPDHVGGSTGAVGICLALAPSLPVPCGSQATDPDLGPPASTSRQHLRMSGGASLGTGLPSARSSRGPRPNSRWRSGSGQPLC